MDICAVNTNQRLGTASTNADYQSSRNVKVSLSKPSFSDHPTGRKRYQSWDKHHEGTVFLLLKHRNQVLKACGKDSSDTGF
jgi:hypothetical protein